MDISERANTGRIYVFSTISIEFHCSETSRCQINFQLLIGLFILRHYYWADRSRAPFVFFFFIVTHDFSGKVRSGDAHHAYRRPI